MVCIFVKKKEKERKKRRWDEWRRGKRNKKKKYKFYVISNNEIKIDFLFPLFFVSLYYFHSSPLISSNQT